MRFWSFVLKFAMAIRLVSFKITFYASKGKLGSCIEETVQEVELIYMTFKPDKTNVS
eukprot:UN20149